MEWHYPCISVTVQTLPQRLNFPAAITVPAFLHLKDVCTLTNFKETLHGLPPQAPAAMRDSGIMGKVHTHNVYVVRQWEQNLFSQPAIEELNLAKAAEIRQDTDDLHDVTIQLPALCSG